MYRVLVLWIALFFVGSSCFGQRKEVNYVKRSQFSRVSYVDDNSALYLSKIECDQMTSCGDLHKEIWFNRDSTVYSYSQQYYADACSDELYTRIDLYYSSNDGNPEYGIYHETADTINLTNSQIWIEKNASSQTAELVIEFRGSTNDSTVTYAIPDHVVDAYINWMNSDVNRLDSLDRPNWPNHQDWIPQKSRTSHYTKKKEGEMHQWTNFFIDTYYHDSGVSIDTVLIQESYSNLVVNEFETSSISTKRTDSTFHKEAFVYYPAQDSTEQEIVELLHGDTVYRMYLTTTLKDGKLFSHYRMRHNSLFQSKYRYYNGTVHSPVILEREIWLERDSLGFVTTGKARGVVVDDQFGNVEASTKLDIRDYQNSGITLVEYNQKPNHINKQINNRRYAVKYNLVSLDINRDLKPLIEIKQLIQYPNNQTYDLMYREFNPPKRNFRLPYIRFNRGKYVPDYKRGTKRIEKDKKRRYEKWEDEQQNLIYEVFFLDKKDRKSK